MLGADFRVQGPWGARGMGTANTGSLHWRHRCASPSVEMTALFGWARGLEFGRGCGAVAGSASKPEVDGDAEEDDGEAEEGVSGLGDDGERQDDEGGEDEEGGEDGVSPDAEGAGSSGDVIAVAEDEDSAGGERVEEPLGEDG